MANEMVSNPARTRRRLMGVLILGLLLVMASAVGLQLGSTGESMRAAWLGGLALGCLLALPASVSVTILNLRGLRSPDLAGELHDELAAQNGVRAMAVGYGAFLVTAGVALPLGVLFALPLGPVLTIVLLAGIVAHLASYVLFERQGDDA